MFRIQSSRGAAFVWRQGDGDLPLPGTLAPRPKWQLRARGVRAAVYAKSRAAASTSTDLTIADATHAHAADGITLTTESTLSVADATHAHAAEEITLSVAGSTSLTVADATHAHSADAITLTAASVLAIQEALHAHAADNLTLLDGETLQLADALHAHTADGLALTVDAWLTVADVRHTHAADNIVLNVPGAYIEGNPRVWLIDARRHYTAIDARNRVVHLS